MTRAGYLLFFGAALFLAGCVPSLHPLYTNNEVVLDPALEGKWHEVDGEDKWEFRKAAEKAYELVYTEGHGQPAKFQAHVVRLGKYRFLDLFPDAPHMNNDFYQGHFVPAHTFYKLELAGNSLRLTAVDVDWVKSKAGDALRHEIVEDSPVLTASTRELQEFVVSHAEDQSVFKDADSLKLLRQQ